MRIWTVTPVQMWLLTGFFWLATSVLALSIRAEYPTLVSIVADRLARAP